MPKLLAALVFLLTTAVPERSLAECPNLGNADFSIAARAQFGCSSTRNLKSLPPGEREFSAKFDFPTDLPVDHSLPWKAIDFKSDPEMYLKALLNYGLKHNSDPEIDWRIENNKIKQWCHAPWFHALRERIHGMTRERSSKAKELHALQTDGAKNWAVGFYNSIGCHAFGTVWKDPSFPKTKDFLFPEGTYSIKLLFTNASVAQVPYLTGSKTWKAAIEDDGSVVEMRLLQVDLAVRDSRADPHTGWVFGTFIYDAYAVGETPWQKLVPVGLMWGNDPGLTTLRYEESGKTAEEGWINPFVADKFFHLPRHNLGLHGRVNGPVDNFKAACLACHGRALDWGRGIDATSGAAEEAKLLLPIAPNPYDESGVKTYFRNLKSDQPFVEGTQSLDYSLQLAGGITNFRNWVLTTFREKEPLTSNVSAYQFKSDKDPSSAATASYMNSLERASSGTTNAGSFSPFSRGED